MRNEQESPKTPTYLLEAEAAEVLRVRPKTLSNKRVTGGGPAYLKCGGRILYAIEDLKSYAEGGRRRSTSDRAARQRRG